MKLEHPLLANPVKWLRHVTKRHSVCNVIHNHYNLSALKNSPYAQFLSDTRKDPSGFRFPIGSMVQLVVTKRDEKYEIAPVLQKPLLGQNPATYVLGNEKYINFLSSKRFRPLPMKYRQRSLAIAGRIQVPDLASAIDSVYREALEVELKREITEDLDPTDTIRVAHGEIEASTDEVVFLPFATKEIVVPLASRLARLALRYSAFKS